jgi:hypothetical protein
MARKKEVEEVVDAALPTPEETVIETPTEAPVETVEEVVDEAPKVAQVVTLGQRNKARQ